MNINIFLVPCEKKHVLRNMLEIYLHDMSEFDDEEDRLELNEAGLYGYSYLDYYWTQPSRFPYLITVDDKIAGFSFVKTTERNQSVYEIAEFFILKKYRKLGVGRTLINEMFSLHKGNWNIDTPIKNLAAQSFWRKVINDNAVGAVEEILIENGRRMQWRFCNTVSA